MNDQGHTDGVGKALEGIEHVAESLPGDVGDKIGIDGVKVHVTYINEVETVTFDERLSATLQKVWDKAYLELEISKNPKDTFQTAGLQPVSLMTHLNLTLAQALEQRVIKDFRFDIVSETGGA